ncbi:eukaryotic elongation factor 2 kinase-like [Asterias rubens]|uniref:eukaryotic elongation factor 2 kinase-like n=1 Tax=Asterias rubens TaxID=7604 RepID=UPI001455CDD1|nr:eukaryotic elongation factor 2 kinase-like [Asterias rubens]
MGSYQSNTSSEIGYSSNRVQFEDDWFAQGAARRAYRGKYCAGPKEGQLCVVKLYKEEWCSHLNELAWKADTRASEKAQEMAVAFNRDRPTSKPIKFVIPDITNVDTSSGFNLLWFIPIASNVKGKLAGTAESSAEMVPKGASIAIEEYLRGEFTKFNSNSSYVNHDVGAYGPGAFSHYTYHKSRGTLLISDIQWIRQADGYHFTDPAVQSVEGVSSYGATDLGVFGIIKFFQNHHCNDLCRGFSKPDLSKIPRDALADVNRLLQAIKQRHSSTYTYELQRAGVPDHRMRQLQMRIPQAIAE